MFTAGDAPSIAGTPTPGTGGSQTVTLTGTNSGGSATQALTIDVYEAPRLAPQTTVNFYAGVENSYSQTATGYPNTSLAPLPLPPGTPDQAPDGGKGMHFLVSHLPSSLRVSNLNSQGYSTGTLTISGTPSPGDRGVHTITVLARNGVGSGFTQTLTMNIGGAPGDVNLDGVVNCTDFNLVKAALDTYRGQPGYNAAADVNNDGLINIDDLAIVSRNLPSGTKCQ
ncbi:MAG: dockerin type I domain-containing protein [Acidobacteriota bacterium]|nr:dockerin type I domain-containing protein [Acidobacteriota bacterium]